MTLQALPATAVWMLLAHDPETGAASAPCGFVTFDGQVAHCELIPGTDTAGWADRWADFGGGRAQLPATLELLAPFVDVGGIGLGVIDLSATVSLTSSAASAASTLVDGFLAAA